MESVWVMGVSALAVVMGRNDIRGITVAVFGAAATAFIIAYEEPALREKFGPAYVEYCRHVRRWLPRLTPFDKARMAAVPSPDLE